MAHKSKKVQEKEDVSVLRTPIQLHGKTVEQILNSIHYGTPELRDLLLDECDIILECKVCRALFRDLANFISHKRGYCTKSVTEDNHLAIARIPDEKVYVVHPQEPQFPPAEISRKPKSKPSLEETIARIQSGELGHSHAFKVYSDAANKLQQQKEEMKIATIRTSAIPTNPNAVFIDVNMASVNIHERSAAVSNNPSKNLSNDGVSIITRKAGEKLSSSKGKSQAKKGRGRILRKDCKNSEELQKLLLKELKEIQHKAKQKSQRNNLPKNSSCKSSPPKVRNNKSDVNVLPSLKVVETNQNAYHAAQASSHSLDPSLVAKDKTSLKHPVLNNKGNDTKPDLMQKDKGKWLSDISRNQIHGKGIIIDDSLNFGNVVKDSVEMDLIRVDRQTIGTLTTRNKLSSADNLVMTNTRNQNDVKISKNKESQSLQLVQSISSRQHSKPFRANGHGNASNTYTNDGQNVRSASVKREPSANVLESTSPSAGTEENMAVPSSKNERTLQARTSRSSPSSKYTLRRKDLICSICHGIFSSNQSLSFHKKIKHSALRTFYPCLYCPSIFYYFYGVTRHLKLQHLKSKSEVNSLRKQLRAKAYTKLLPEKEDDAKMEQSKGLRKSLRSKQEAYSSQTSPDSSYVFHSVKKSGRKLSAKKDAFNASQETEQPKESNTNNEENKGDKNSMISGIKQEISNTPVKLASSDSSVSQANIEKSKSKRKITQRNSNASPLSPKSSPSGQLSLHTCKKCKRYFGRYLTYKNHIKTCQAQGTVLSHRRNRGRPCKNSLVHSSHSDSTVLTRHQTMERGRKRIGSKRHLSKKFKPSSQLHQITRSSRKETLRCVYSLKQEHSETESSHLSRKQKMLCMENNKRDVSISSCSTAQLHDSASCDQIDSSKSHSPKESTEIPNNEIKTEKNSLKTLSSETIDSTSQEKKDCDDSIEVSNHAGGIGKPKTRTCPQKLPNLSTDKFMESFEAAEEDEKDHKKATEAIRNSTGMKVTPASQVVTTKSKPPPFINTRDKRTSSVERDVRGKISHLVPRFPIQNSASNKEVINQSMPSSDIANEPRPKRKRKVPSWNMDAMEMLTKIHNPEKDNQSVKKKDVNREIDTNSILKSMRDKSVLRGNISKAETERGSSVENSQKELKDEDVSKNLSRKFKMGRKKSRGRKLLRAYDNARVDKLIDVQNCKCLVCGEICTQIFNLRRHVIRIHLQWSRFQCKLCRFASFDRSECTTHIIRNHNREIDVKNAQVINTYITDLAKQSLQLMNMKKNQTLRNKSKAQNRDTNIYARPNVRKMPRLAERTLSQGRKAESLSSVDKETALVNIKVKHSVKKETMTCDALDLQSSKNSIPFNISTRNSPRVFDIRPYKSSGSSDVQGEVVVLHTRKGVYTKTVPCLPLKENAESETKDVVPKDCKSATVTMINNSVTDDLEKPSFEAIDLLSRNKSDNKGHSDFFESRKEDQHLSKENQESIKPMCNNVFLVDKESGNELAQQNSFSNKDMNLTKDPTSHSKICPQNLSQSFVASPSSASNPTEVDKDHDSPSVAIAFIESPGNSPKPSSSSPNMYPIVSLVNSPKAKQLIPSYINYTTAHLCDSDTLDNCSSSATKVLRFSVESQSTTGTSTIPGKESKSESTLLDDIDAETSSAAMEEYAESEQI